MNDTLKIVLYIATMALVTYLIRMTPFVLFRKKIQSHFFRSVLFYLPYAVISAMIIPSVFSSTGNFLTAISGFAAACLLAFFGRSLIVVALGASIAAYVTGLVLNLL